MRMISEEHERRLTAAYLNPSAEAMHWFWVEEWGPLPREEVCLAGLHKGRMRWEHSTPAMVEESRQWLLDHGFSIGRDRRPISNQ